MEEATSDTPAIDSEDGACSSLRISSEVSDLKVTSLNCEEMSTDFHENHNGLGFSKNDQEMNGFIGNESMALCGTTLHEDVDQQDSLASTSLNHSSASLASPDGMKVQDESMDDDEEKAQSIVNSEIAKCEDQGLESTEKTVKEEEDVKPCVTEGDISYDSVVNQTCGDFLPPLNESLSIETDDKVEAKSDLQIGSTDLDNGSNGSFVNESVVCEDSVICVSVVSEEIAVEVQSVTVGNPESVSKTYMSSEDEGVHLYTNCGKSEAESSSSKDESPSGPSCSGTSRAGVNSLSSDSEDDLPNLSLTLPIKKRKRDRVVEVVSSSCSEDEGKSEIDYSNLTPDEIKALIEEAKRYGNIKRKCKCPKKKWAELPIKGPTEGSGKCTIGKGDWSEKSTLSCEACADGSCAQGSHRHGRRSRRRGILSYSQPRLNILSRTRARGTIGQDVPVIELSDSEELISTPRSVASEVKIAVMPAVPGECIVLSSSEDDDEIVCEGVVRTETKNQATGTDVLNLGAAPKESSPDVVVVNASNPEPLFPLSVSSGLFDVPSAVPQMQMPLPPVQDTEHWPDFGMDLENWSDTMNLLATIHADGAINNRPQVNASAALPERPPSPEGWSCPICLESKTAVQEIMSTMCGHVFCGNCIRSAVKSNKKCPTCRKKLTLKQFHKIFL